MVIHLCATFVTCVFGAWLPQEALTEEERIVHLLNRFTFGATPELVAEVRREGIGPWFARQLAGQTPEPESYTSRVNRLETLELSWKEICEQYAERPPKGATEAEKREARQRSHIPGRELLAWIGLRAVYGANVVREVSSDFFRNHFSVSMDKGPVHLLAVDWEREVILKHALGTFGDMLEASAKHPAMLFFLDNHLSRRPATPEELRFLETRERRRTGSEEQAEQAVGVAKQRGLNENYARELMELHTLGVDNGYTQTDVINVAKCFTGWTISRRKDEARFQFNARVHCPGDKPFLGGVIREKPDQAIAEGEEVLRILKSHERTAHFLAWKLCRWFVSDEPNDAMVQRVADCYRKNSGDLPKLYTAIVEDPAFFQRENFRTKLKRPFEFIVSALRVTHAEINRLEGLHQYLSRMNEPLYRCPEPTGYYDQAEAWCDPGAMAVRWAFAMDFATGKIPGVRIPAAFFSDLPADRPETWKDALAAKVLPAVKLSRTTEERIEELIKTKGASQQAGTAIVAILLGSPEFQRQ